MDNMRIETITVGPFEVNCYLVFDPAGKNGIIIDPGGDDYKIEEGIDHLGFTPRAILLTHGHGDHIAAVEALKKRFHLPLYVGRGDEPLLASPSANISAYFGFEITCPPADFTLNDNDVVDISGLKFSVFATPGHSPGSVCYFANKFLFCGDVLFNGSIGRTDLPGGSYQQLIDSIDRSILSLPDDIICYPGHGPITTVGSERKNNPFLTGRHFV
ncbi:Beta-lactamase protein [Candidatus Zixiibacteriota bacterium]|nr:Beta-lactamase protein [candidate division Zixibacteria bacterium]